MILLVLLLLSIRNKYYHSNILTFMVIKKTCIIIFIRVHDTERNITFETPRSRLTLKNIQIVSRT